MILDTEGLIERFEAFLDPGIKVIVHSSLRSFGLVKDGAPAVLRALMELVTAHGLIMMPAFTYGRQPFDVHNTPAQTGKISEAFRLMKGVRRSQHPTHSFCAWGHEAEDILAGHKVTAPFSKDTPLDKFAQRGGYVLLMGVTHTANSLIHVAQEHAHVPYLDRPKLVKVMEAGALQEMVVRRAGCSLGFDRISPFLDERGLVEKHKVGDSNILLMKAGAVLERVTEVLTNDPYILACDNPGCYSCNEMQAFRAR